MEAAFIIKEAGSEGEKGRYLKLLYQQLISAYESVEKLSRLHSSSVKKGVSNARQKGKQIGRRAGSHSVTQKEIKAREQIIALSRDFEGTLSDGEVISRLGINRNTYYKYKKALKAEKSQKPNRNGMVPLPILVLLSLIYHIE